MKIGTPITSSGMGDVLLLTAICRHKRDCVVELHPSAQKFSCFFDNICESVSITDNPLVTPDIGDDTFLERKLRACGLEGKLAMPYVELSLKDKQESFNLIKKYKNPIILVTNCSVRWRHVREINPEIWQNIIYKLKEKYTFLQFGISDNFTPFEYTLHFKDLELKEQMMYYYSCGNYLGVDTGDRHLASALGCKTTVVCPNEGNGYFYKDWHYSKNFINYINVNEINKILNIL